MTARRASKLNWRCGKAIALSEADDREPGMPARKGTAFHSGYAFRRSGDPRHAAAWGAALEDLRKAPKALAEVESWIFLALEKWPVPSSATFEEAIGIDAFGDYVPHNSPDAVVVGHADFHWDAGDHVVVGDAKSSQFDQGAPEKLIQLQAYGTAIGSRAGKPVRLAIGYARTGAWVESPTLEADWRGVLNAAALPPVAVLGPWCETTCFNRKLCPSYLAANIPSFAPQVTE